MGWGNPGDNATYLPVLWIPRAWGRVPTTSMDPRSLGPWEALGSPLGLGSYGSLGSRVLWKSENPKTQVHQQKPSPYYCLRLLFSPQSSSCRYVFFLSLSDGVAMLDFINFWPFVSHTDGHCFSFLRRFPVIPGIPTKTCK